MKDYRATKNGTHRKGHLMLQRLIRGVALTLSVAVVIGCTSQELVHGMVLASVLAGTFVTLTFMVHRPWQKVLLIIAAFILMFLSNEARYELESRKSAEQSKSSYEVIDEALKSSDPVRFRDIEARNKAIYDAKAKFIASTKSADPATWAASADIRAKIVATSLSSLSNRRTAAASKLASAANVMSTALINAITVETDTAYDAANTAIFEHDEALYAYRAAAAEFTKAYVAYTAEADDAQSETGARSETTWAYIIRTITETGEKYVADMAPVLTHNLSVSSAFTAAAENQDYITLAKISGTYADSYPPMVAVLTTHSTAMAKIASNANNFP